MFDSLKMLNGFELLNNFKGLDAFEVVIGLKQFDENKWLGFSKQTNSFIAYEVFRIIKE